MATGRNDPLLQLIATVDADGSRFQQVFLAAAETLNRTAATVTGLATKLDAGAKAGDAFAGGAQRAGAGADGLRTRIDQLDRGIEKLTVDLATFQTEAAGLGDAVPADLKAKIDATTSAIAKLEAAAGLARTELAQLGAVERIDALAEGSKEAESALKDLGGAVDKAKDTFGDLEETDLEKLASEIKRAESESQKLDRALEEARREADTLAAGSRRTEALAQIAAMEKRSADLKTKLGEARAELQRMNSDSLANVNAQLERMANAADAVEARYGRVIGVAKGAGAALMGVGAAILGALGAATVAAMKFEDSFARARAQMVAAGEGAAAIDAMKDTILAAARETGVATGEIAEHVAEMLKDLSSDETKAILITQIKAAKVAGADLATTNGLMARTMKAFNLEAKDTEPLLKAMAAQAAAGGVSFEDLSQGVGKVGAIMNAVGGSANDMVAVLGAMSDAGVPAKNQMAALTEILQLAVSPTEKQSQALKAMGAEFDEETIKAKGFRGALLDFLQTVKDANDSGLKLDIIDEKAQREAMSAMNALLDRRKELEESLVPTAEERRKLAREEAEYEKAIADLQEKKAEKERELADLRLQSVERKKLERDLERDIVDLQERKAELEGRLKALDRNENLPATATVQAEINSLLEQQQDLQRRIAGASGSEKAQLQAALDRVSATLAAKAVELEQLREIARVQSELADLSARLASASGAERDALLSEFAALNDSLDAAKQKRIDALEKLDTSEADQKRQDIKDQIAEIGDKLSEARDKKREALEEFDDKAAAKRKAVADDIEEINERLKETKQRRAEALEDYADKGAEERERVKKDLAEINAKIAEQQAKYDGATTSVSALQAAQMLFGSSSDGILKLIGKGTDELSARYDSLGQAQEEFAQRAQVLGDTTQAAVNRMGEAFNGAAIKTGEANLGALKDKAQGIADAMGAVTEKNPGFLESLNSWGLGAGVASGAIGGLVTALAFVLPNLAALKIAFPGAFASAGAAVSKLTALIAGIPLAVAGLVLVIVGALGYLAAKLYEYWDIVKLILSERGIGGTVLDFISWLSNALGLDWIVERLADMLVWAKDALSEFWGWLTDLWDSGVKKLGDLMAPILDKVRWLVEKAQEIGGSIAGAIGLGGGSEAPPSFSGGGVFSGRAGLAMLHGPEAVIPLANGAVPVRLTTASGAPAAAAGRGDTISFHITQQPGESGESLAQRVASILMRRRG